ncbi:hypothetical protein IFT84_17540 [Rhizobium sp. CFBP 8762]|uniref:hypothetical protein n=1 Tax=Rhizobium sp. CFBP 8762 TaxID=2775279 RepID=UPI00177FCEDA|nr:hypothetical protein [Rhizobium sp. CFBP 8762]MBD8556314.1 hypothetical protein [Rhizobium sp. CFBP 8762]
MSNEPINEEAYLHGTTVVDIGDLRVARGLTRRPVSSCHHLRMNYDPRERRVWCKDCEQDVDPFDAFKGLVEHIGSARKSMEKRIQELREAETFQCRSVAAKNLDKAWRSRNRVPACPHCHQGLFPEDFSKSVNTLGRDYALARRKAAIK